MVDFTRDVELLVVQMWFTGALIAVPAIAVLLKMAWDAWVETHPRFEWFTAPKPYVKMWRPTPG